MIALGVYARGGEAQADGLQQAFVGGSGQRLFQIRSRAGRGLPVKAQRAAGEAEGGFELFQRKRHAAAGGEHNDALNVRHPHSVAEVVGGAFQLPGPTSREAGKGAEAGVPLLRACGACFRRAGAGLLHRKFHRPEFFRRGRIGTLRARKARQVPKPCPYPLGQLWKGRSSGRDSGCRINGNGSEGDVNDETACCRSE